MSQEERKLYIDKLTEAVLRGKNLGLPDEEIKQDLENLLNE